MTPTDSQAARLLREVLEECEGVGCEPCIGSYSPFEDLCGRIKAHLDNTSPREDAGVVDDAMARRALMAFRQEEVNQFGNTTTPYNGARIECMKAALVAALGESNG